MPKIPEYDSRVGLKQPPATPTKDYGLEVRAKLAPIAAVSEASQAFSSLAGLAKRIESEEDTAASSELASKLAMLYQAGTEQNRAQHPDPDAFMGAQEELKKKIYSLNDTLSKNDRIKARSRMLFDNHLLPLRMKDAEEVAKKRLNAITGGYMNSMNFALQEFVDAPADQTDIAAARLWSATGEGAGPLGYIHYQKFQELLSNGLMQRFKAELPNVEGTREAEDALVNKYKSFTLKTPEGDRSFPGLDEAAMRNAIRQEETFRHTKEEQEHTRSIRQSKDNASAAMVDLLQRIVGVTDEGELRGIVNSWSDGVGSISLRHEDHAALLAHAQKVLDQGPSDTTDANLLMRDITYRIAMGRMTYTDALKEIAPKVGNGLSTKSATTILEHARQLSIGNANRSWSDAQQRLAHALQKKAGGFDLFGSTITDEQHQAIQDAFTDLYHTMTRIPDATGEQVDKYVERIIEKYKDRALGKTGMLGKPIPGITRDNFYEKLLEEANTPVWTVGTIADWRATIRTLSPNPADPFNLYSETELMKGAVGQGKWQPGKEIKDNAGKGKQ